MTDAEITALIEEIATHKKQVSDKDDVISPDDIWMYYDELCAIYKSQTIYENPDQIEAAVDALCDDGRATLQTNISRIKRKLVEKVGKIAADQYAIVRGKDNIYRIAVPRDLVIIPA